VDIEGVARTPIPGGDDAGGPVDDHAEVADPALVQDGVERGAVTEATLSQPSQTGAIGRGQGCSAHVELP
jgi:hypothetical protein